MTSLFSNVGELIGMIAAICTTAAFLPQAIKVIKDRQTKALSLTMYAVFTTGVALWFAYGLMIVSAPVAIANAVTFILAATILGMKLRYG